MAKARARKLKVFQTQIGFYDSVVAVPSREAALKAWGTRQNLFENGSAFPVTDPVVTKAAMAQPETPLRRAVGSDAPFELEPRALPKVPDEPRRAKAKSAPGAKHSAPTVPPPDRSRLDTAEAMLKTLEDGRKREEAQLKRRQDELEAEIAEAQVTYVRERKATRAAIAEARKAYRAAGGRD